MRQTADRSGLSDNGIEWNKLSFVCLLKQTGQKRGCMNENVLPEGCRDYIYSEDSLDFFLPYNGDIEAAREEYKPDCLQYLNQEYLIVHFYAPTSAIYSGRFAVAYGSIPKCYALQQDGGEIVGTDAGDSFSVLEAMGIGRLRRLPYLDLYGRGVLIGLIDTGIDYRHPVFINPDGSSRIYAIWDQTEAAGPAPEGFDYGREYRQEELEQALSAENPLELVPETDDNGHGTFMAGLAAGNISERNSFSGAAPQAEIVMVKLKQAKEYLRRFYAIPEGVPCYQETDLAQGIRYLAETAQRADRPLVLVMTLGTNSGGHDGSSILDELLDSLAVQNSVCVITSTGNENGYALHYRGLEEPEAENTYEEVELRVAEGENGFTMELWATSLNLYSISVISPTGELIERSPGRGNRFQVMNFIFENTLIYLDYYMVENRSGEQLVLLRVYAPTPGIWRFRIYTEQEFGGNFDLWLPVHTFVEAETYFIRPDPDVTITGPGNGDRAITVASYRVSDKAIYLHSGRGFTRSGNLKPDLAAPGVEIYGPLPNGRFGIGSGGGAAAALTAGACALLLEWAVVQGRRPMIDTSAIKRLLKGGAEREGIRFPNREWGFGRLDIYGAFEELRIVVNS
ncbi:MAG: S8 family peptidase [Lachnospiraceae bacterium]|nr:S8 family peptidase [Lachnospiraceae bacterium]